MIRIYKQKIEECLYRIINRYPVTLLDSEGFLSVKRFLTPRRRARATLELRMGGKKPVAVGRVTREDLRKIDRSN